MPAIEYPSVVDDVRTLPPEGRGRDRQLQRIVDTYASTEAAAALRNAAAGARGDSGVVGSLLTSADAVLGAGGDLGLLSDEAVAALDRMREAAASNEMLSLIADWVRELRYLASSRPDTGACTLATALELWLWTMKHFRSGEGALDQLAPAAIDELAEALCPLVAARYLALEIAANESPSNRSVDELRRDLCHVYSAHASASAGAVCAELVFGYRRHLRWDAEGCAACYAGDDLDDLEALMPGIASGARMSADVVEADGSHPAKAGPCASFEGMDGFMRLRHKIDGCLTGARIAKERAATTIANRIDAVPRPKQSEVSA